MRRWDPLTPPLRSPGVVLFPGVVRMVVLDGVPMVFPRRTVPWPQTFHRLFHLYLPHTTHLVLLHVHVPRLWCHLPGPTHSSTFPTVLSHMGLGVYFIDLILTVAHPFPTDLQFLGLVFTRWAFPCLIGRGSDGSFTYRGVPTWIMIPHVGQFYSVPHRPGETSPGSTFPGWLGGPRLDYIRWICRLPFYVGYFTVYCLLTRCRLPQFLHLCGLFALVLPIPPPSWW